MHGLKFRIGKNDRVIVSFRQHSFGGGDSCLIRLSVRVGSLHVRGDALVAKSNLAQFVASIQTIFESSTGEATLHHESGPALLSVVVDIRGQIKVHVRCSGYHPGYYAGEPDHASWDAEARFSCYPQGHLVFIDTGGLDVNRGFLARDA